jgi:membrane protein YdbS with pleckstrin-like domain
LILTRGRGENAANEVMVGVITTQRLLYWLAAMVALLIVGTTIGLIWADTSNVAGAFAGVTNLISLVGIVVLLIAIAVKRRRRPS